MRYEKVLLVAVTVLGSIFGAFLTLLAIPGTFKGLGGAIGDRTHLAFHLGEGCGSLMLLLLGIFIVKNAVLIPGKLNQRQRQPQQ